MERFLILKLAGPMQAWGAHTFEDYRPVEDFPTRSGLLGLLGACLGLRRDDVAGQKALAESVRIAVRADRRSAADLWLATGRSETTRPVRAPLPAVRITDFHTVLDARTVGGGVRKDPVVSRREYLCDGVFTVAVGFRADAAFGPDDLALAVRRPVFTPSLGRRSCPLARPLFEAVIEAVDLGAALDLIWPHAGRVYAEEGDGLRLRVRDVPVIVRPRQFAAREVFVETREAGGADVSEPD